MPLPGEVISELVSIEYAEPLPKPIAGCAVGDIEVRPLEFPKGALKNRPKGWMVQHVFAVLKSKRPSDPTGS
jgi:hypothetical protein